VQFEKFRLEIIVPYHGEMKGIKKAIFVGLVDLYVTQIPRIGELINTENLTFPGFSGDLIVTTIEHTPLLAESKLSIDRPHIWVTAQLENEERADTKEIYDYLEKNDKSTEKDRHWEYSGDQ